MTGDDGPAGTATGRVPLSALLSQLLAVFTAEWEREMAEAGFGDLSLATGSNVLRFLGAEGLRIGAIAQLAGVSKQAISQQVAYLERQGYVRIDPDPHDSRAKVVSLTERGLATREVARPLFGELERRWAARYGAEEVARLRQALEAVVGQLGGALPHYPVERVRR